MDMKSISLDAAVIIGGRSKRTWWRRIAEGSVARLENDFRGRTMLSFEEVLPLVCIPFEGDDLDLILKADSGNAEAQNDIGQIFSSAGKYDIALYWLRMAADQGHPDAMQSLGNFYISGKGVKRDENLGIMWLAKSASCGHQIAQAQMKCLNPF